MAHLVLCLVNAVHTMFLVALGVNLLLLEQSNHLVIHRDCQGRDLSLAVEGQEHSVLVRRVGLTSV